MLDARQAMLDGYRTMKPEAQYVEIGPEWCGRPQWACSLCTFKTTSRDVEKAFRHVREQHADFILAGEPVADEAPSVEKVTRVIESSLVSPTGDKLFYEERGD